MRSRAVVAPALALVLTFALASCAVESCEERNKDAIEIVEQEIRSAGAPLSLEEQRSNCGDSAQLPVVYYSRDGADWSEVEVSLENAGWEESSDEEGVWSLDANGLRIVAGPQDGESHGRVGVIAYFLD